MPTISVNAVYRVLEKEYGNQHWWPGRSRLEIIAGAILTQNTSWTNVERCIRTLKKRHWLSVNRMCALKAADLAPVIRASGYYNQKSVKLISFLKFLSEKHNGSLSCLAHLETGELRTQLLLLNGIGPETADSILLYAFRRPVFVVDAYTRRIFTRLGILCGNEDYEAIRQYFEKCLKAGSHKNLLYVLNQYHALIVELGKRCCRPNRPDCGQCPLRKFEKCGSASRIS